MKDLETEKSIRLQNFLKENPTWYEINFPKALEREMRIQKKIIFMSDVLELRNKNKLSFEEIGSRYGLSKQRIHQIIKIFYP